MSSGLLFWAVFCIHYVAERLKISEAEAYKLLTGGGDILDSYILPYYEPLHTQGKDYIVDELIELMKQEGIVV